MITDDQIAELRALAIATLNACAKHDAPYPDERFWRMYAREDIADYTARANPDALLALLDRLASAERERDAARDSLGYVRSEIERVLAEHESAASGRTGIQVPYRGPLAAVAHLPSVARTLREWLRAITGGAS